MKLAMYLNYAAALLAAVFLAGSASCADAQTTESDPGLLHRCGGYFGLCGYISKSDWLDNRVETEVLPKIYEALGDYSEGLAPVRVKGRWGSWTETA